MLQTVRNRRELAREQSMLLCQGGGACSAVTGTHNRRMQPARSSPASCAHLFVVERLASQLGSAGIGGAMARPRLQPALARPSSLGAVPARDFWLWFFAAHPLLVPLAASYLLAACSAPCRNLHRAAIMSDLVRGWGKRPETLSGEGRRSAKRRVRTLLRPSLRGRRDPSGNSARNHDEAQLWRGRKKERIEAREEL